LINALHDSFILLSSKWYLVYAFIPVPLIIAALVVVAHGLKTDGTIWLFIGWWIPAFVYLVWRMRQDERNEVYQNIAHALVSVAERTQTLSLRVVISDLSRLACDVILQKRATRKTAREAARRIEVVTAQLKSLPIPAATSKPDVEELPIPVSTPAHDAATLPRAAEESQPR
jgi:hypothetical protein